MNLTNKTDHWNAKFYDNNHAFVAQYGKGLIDLLSPQSKEKILDLGCGTGDVTATIYQQVDGIELIGVDSSANMVERAKVKYPHIDFQVADAINLPFDDEFDAIFSNAVLHWIKTPEMVLQNIYKSLKKNGRFVAEFGGKDNVKGIMNGLIQQFELLNIPFPEEKFPWYFPSIAEYTTLMEQAGFRVTLAQHYDRPTILDGNDGLKNWLEMFGPTIFENIETTIKDHIIEETAKSLKNTLFINDVWYADYKRIRVVGLKE